MLLFPVLEKYVNLFTVYFSQMENSGVVHMLRTSKVEGKNDLHTWTRFVCFFFLGGGGGGGGVALVISLCLLGA